MSGYTTSRKPRNGYMLCIVETILDDSHTVEIADDRDIVPFGISVVYDSALAAPNQLKLYLPASWSDGLLAEDVGCVLAMVAEAADYTATLPRRYAIAKDQTTLSCTAR